MVTNLQRSASGNRNRATSKLTNIGNGAIQWLSSSTGKGSSNSTYLDAYAHYVDPLHNNGRSYGFSVRCVQEFE